MALRAPLTLFAVALLSSQAAGASDDGTPWFQETIAFKGAAIFAFIDSDVTYNGRDLDLEDDLDLDDFSVLPSLDLRWRFTRNRKHRFEAGYFSILRSDKRILQFDLELPDGRPIDISAKFKTDLDVHIATLTYGYSFLHREQLEFGLFAGLDFIVADAKVSGTCSVPGLDPVECDDDLIEENFNIPFPTAGLYLDWAFAEKLALMTRFQYFGVKFEGIHGQLFRGKVRLQHRTFRHVDLFLGYDVLGANVDFDSSSFEWLGLVYHGPTLGLVLRF
jgi:hypothetical protein